VTKDRLHEVAASKQNMLTYAEFEKALLRTYLIYKDKQQSNEEP